MQITTVGVSGAFSIRLNKTKDKDAIEDPNAAKVNDHLMYRFLTLE